MAGTIADMKIYNEQFFGGANEVLSQNVAAFNELSLGAIVYVLQMMKGNSSTESFFKEISGLITDRDPTSVADAAVLKLTQGEDISPKVSKKIGPVEHTLDSFKKDNIDPDSYPFVLGQKAAPAIEQAFLESALSALRGCFETVAGAEMSYFAAGEATGTMTHEHLVKGMQKRGDKASEIVMWVMHSKTYFDLVGNAVAEKIYGEAGNVVYGGLPGTFGKPVLVTDSDSLIEIDGGGAGIDYYTTYGLVPGATTVSESEERSILLETIGGKENLLMRFQGEMAYNLNVQGFSFTGAGLNPSNSALAALANWTFTKSSYKSGPGIAIISL